MRYICLAAVLALLGAGASSATSRLPPSRPRKICPPSASTYRGRAPIGGGTTAWRGSAAHYRTTTFASAVIVSSQWPGAAGMFWHEERRSGAGAR